MFFFFFFFFFFFWDALKMTGLHPRMRADIIVHFEACMTEIYLHIDARI
eukprot:COSAG05_NODE_8_length_40675_cov_148.837539_11_plen_49_part_00